MTMGQSLALLAIPVALRVSIPVCALYFSASQQIVTLLSRVHNSILAGPMEISQIYCSLMASHEDQVQTN